MVIMANEKTRKNAAEEAYKIGDHLKEGKLKTVVIGFDDNKDPIRVLEEVFIGKADFENQDKAIAEANKRLGLTGAKALTRLNNQECEKLAKAFDKVAPPALQGSAAPWFWGDGDYSAGRIYSAGDGEWRTVSDVLNMYHPRDVPAALRGPVQN
jgi:hypothetical protein